MKKFFTSLFILIASITGMFAMPCFESFIPDESGEYVYYQDNTFKRKSYVGILYYDDSALQVRYFAPQDLENKLPSKSIELLVSIDVTADHLEMTGERFLTTIMPGEEDTEIINYLHDILYEFTARRSKIMMISPTAAGYVSNASWKENGIKISQDFPQFGGNVDVHYDAMVPLFNIKNIYDSEGNATLECVAMGKITSAEDKGFSNFSGFAPAQSYSQIKSKNKDKPQTVHYQNQSLTIDSKWTMQMENCWTYGDNSVITLSSMPSFSQEQFFNTNFILRKLLLSSNGFYIDLTKSELLYYPKKNQIKIIAENWQSESSKSIINVKVITEKFEDNKTNKFDYFSLSTFKKPYEENRTYFEKIIKSYESK